MIVYRVQSFFARESGQDWTNEYFATREEGKRGLAKSAGFRARLDRLDVPTDKRGLCEFLNLADASHMNQPVIEEVAKK